jgi:hypothetical protein
MPRTYVYQKPLPNESLYKHIQMLHNYCQEQGETDIHQRRGEAFKKVAKMLSRIGSSDAMRLLQEFGE